MLRIKAGKNADVTTVSDATTSSAPVLEAVKPVLKQAESFNFVYFSPLK